MLLGSYGPEAFRRDSGKASDGGNRRTKPGERTPTREVGNREFVPLVRSMDAEG